MKTAFMDICQIQTNSALLDYTRWLLFLMDSAGKFSMYELYAGQWSLCLRRSSIHIQDTRHDLYSIQDAIYSQDTYHSSILIFY